MPDLSHDLRLIRADNASPLTGTGTNTYILGRGAVAVIDPGPDLSSHLDAILSALAPGEEVRQILVTHAHLDHTALVPRLKQATGAEVLAFGPADAGRSAVMADLANNGMTSGESADTGFAPDRTLSDGQQWHMGGVDIEALHLPGHMGCHMGFAVGDRLFSGDHVMEWSTTLVSPPDGDMAAYMHSLARLSRRRWDVMYPGHGPSVENPTVRLTNLVCHRLAREAAILGSLRHVGPATVKTLTSRIYTDVAPPLLPAAARNVLAHLIDLADRGLVLAEPGSPTKANFRAL